MHNLKKIYPQLPDVSNNAESLKAWVDIATQILRTLTGQHGSQGQANSVIVTRQDKPSQVEPDGLRNGDLWIALPAQATQPLGRYVWFNDEWVPMNVLW